MSDSDDLIDHALDWLLCPLGLVALTLMVAICLGGIRCEIHMRHEPVSTEIAND